jgi:hypothetical protein
MMAFGMLHHLACRLSLFPVCSGMMYIRQHSMQSK